MVYPISQANMIKTRRVLPARIWEWKDFFRF